MFSPRRDLGEILVGPGSAGFTYLIIFADDSLFRENIVIIIDFLLNYLKEILLLAVRYISITDWLRTHWETDICLHVWQKTESTCSYSSSQQKIQTIIFV